MLKSRKKRKGFTLTELAIVIAVIAILIAVLVPTFVSLINSAKLSADEQATKNMNTALATDEAINGKPSNLAEAQEVLEAAGFSAELIPTTNGCYYFWNSEYNIVMLIDVSGNEWELIYPTTDDAGNAYTEYKSSCYNLDASNVNVYQTAILEAIDKGTTIKVGSSTDESNSVYGLDQIVDLANTYGETFEGATIQLNADITNYSADPIKNFQGTFDGKDKSITVKDNGIVPVYGENGNGYLYSNLYKQEDGVYKIKYGYGLFASVTDGGIVENLTVTYEDSDYPKDPGNEFTYFGGIAGMLDGGTISGCTVTGTIKQYNRVGGVVGTALSGTISDCKVTANIYSSAVSSSTYWKTNANGEKVQNDWKAYSYAGGIVAYVGNSSATSKTLTISGCTVGGTASGSETTIYADYWAAGGVMAWVADGMNSISITDTTVQHVKIKQSTQSYLGAVCGSVNTATVTITGNVTYTNVTLYVGDTSQTLKDIGNINSGSTADNLTFTSSGS